jgi:hypothetical protein
MIEALGGLRELDMTAVLALLRDHRLAGKRIAAPKREGALAGPTTKMAAMSPARVRAALGTSIG